MRFTGNPLGKRKDGRIESATWKARFFPDSDLTTTVRWYVVPDDRPVVPFPSFVCNEGWHNDNGPASGMLYGQVAPQIGSDESGPKYEAVAPRDDFNPHHLCGTKEEWAGKMTVTKPGRLDCCNPIGTAHIHISPMSEWVQGPAGCPFCGNTPSPATWWIVAYGGDGLYATLNGTYTVSKDVFNLFGCDWQTEYFPLNVSLVLNSVGASVSYTGFGAVANYRLTPPAGRCDYPLILPLLNYEIGVGVPPPFVVAYPYDPDGRRSYAFAGRANGYPWREWPRRTTPMHITPRSTWFIPAAFSFSGDAALAVVPSQDFAQHGATDCYACTEIGLSFSFPADAAWASAFAGLAGGGQSFYVGACNYSNVIAGFNVTLAVGSSVSILTFHNPSTFDDATYQYNGPACLGPTTFLFSSGTSPADCPASVTINQTVP